MVMEEGKLQKKLIRLYGDDTIDWSQIDKNEYLSAMRESVSGSSHIKDLARPALTTKIDDREMFMKGIDYSCYCEQND